MGYFATAADPLYVVHSVDRRLARHHLPAFRGLVLDLGAGDQPFRDLVSPGTSYVATDRTPSPGISLCCDVTALPFPDEVFDGIICTEVIEHVVTPWVALEEISRCLRGGGRLYLTAPMNWHHHYEPYDFYRFTRHGMEALVLRAGLQVVEVERGGGMFTAGAGKVTESIWSSLLIPVLRATGHPWRLYRWVSRLLFPIAWVSSLICQLLDRGFPGDAYIWAVVAEKPRLAVAEPGAVSTEVALTVV